MKFEALVQHVLFLEARVSLYDELLSYMEQIVSGEVEAISPELHRRRKEVTESVVKDIDKYRIQSLEEIKKLKSIEVKVDGKDNKDVAKRGRKAPTKRSKKVVK